MKTKNLVIIVIFLMVWLSEANARFGVHASKPALAHSPNWLVIIIFSIGAIFMLSFLRDVFEDYKDVTDGEEKRNGYLMKALGIFGFIGCIYLVFNAAFG